MATYYTLTWTPNGAATSQMVKYRQLGSTIWNTTPNVSPANPQVTATATATVSNLTANTIYEFQIDAICSSVTNSSNISQMIIYTQETVTHAVVGGVISVNQNPMTSVNTVQYRLVAGTGGGILQNVSATGLNPAASFTTESTGSYTVQYRYGTIVNGVTLYSDDVSEANAWYTTGTINIP